MTEVRSGKYYISLNWAPFEESEPKRPHGSFQLPRQEHKAESDVLFNRYRRVSRKKNQRELAFCGPWWGQNQQNLGAPDSKILHSGHLCPVCKQHRLNGRN